MPEVFREGFGFLLVIGPIKQLRMNSGKVPGQIDINFTIRISPVPKSFAKLVVHVEDFHAHKNLPKP